MVWLPSHNICESRAELGIFLIAGYLAPFETEAGINAETLIVEVSGTQSATSAEGKAENALIWLCLPVSW